MPMDAARSVPHRRERPSDRHRAPARPLRDRALFAPPIATRWREERSMGLIKRHPAHHGLRSFARKHRACRRLARRAQSAASAISSTAPSRKPGALFDVFNPATRRTLAQVTQGSPKDIDAAVAAARKAQPKWAALSGYRAGAASLCAGAPCAEARALSRRCWRRSTTASRSASRATSTFRWSPAISTITPAGPR